MSVPLCRYCQKLPVEEESDYCGGACEYDAENHGNCEGCGAFVTKDENHHDRLTNCLCAGCARFYRKERRA